MKKLTLILVLLIASSVMGHDRKYEPNCDPEYWTNLREVGTLYAGDWGKPKRIPDRWAFRKVITETCIDTTWTKKVPIYLTPKQGEKLTELLDIIEFIDTLDDGCRYLWMKRPMYLAPDSANFVGCRSVLHVVSPNLRSSWDSPLLIGLNKDTVTYMEDSCLTK